MCNMSSYLPVFEEISYGWNHSWRKDLQKTKLDRNNCSWVEKQICTQPCLSVLEINICCFTEKFIVSSLYLFRLIKSNFFCSFVCYSVVCFLQGKVNTNH